MTGTPTHILQQEQKTNHFIESYVLTQLQLLNQSAILNQQNKSISTRKME